MAKSRVNKLSKTPTNWLYISSTTDKDLILAVVNDGKVARVKTIVQGATTENLLKSLDSFVKSEKLSIEGIGLVQDHLGFSQSRLLVAVVNSLVYAWHIKTSSLGSDRQLDYWARKSATLKWSSAIVPRYQK